MMVRRIGFVLCSSLSRPIPSTRIAVLNMMPSLSAAGLQPVILFSPQDPTETPDLSGVAKQAFDAGCDTVVFQKVHGPNVISLVRCLKAHGIRSIFMVCDLVDAEMAHESGLTIVISEFLRSLYPISLQHKIHVVHDGIERPRIFKSDWGMGSGSRIDPLKAVLVTSSTLDDIPVFKKPPPWLQVRIVGRYASGLRRFREARWAWIKKLPKDRANYFFFLANPGIKCIPWGPDEVYAEMMRADIGIIPIETTETGIRSELIPSWKVKSENRLTMKMSIGLPVVATPIPSYEAVIEHGVNGFFALSKRDWTTCLEALRDPGLRQQIGMAARRSVCSRYSMQAQAAKLIRILSLEP